MMKQIFSAIFLLVLATIAKAQNVGVGTTAPAYNLHINSDPLRDTNYVGITTRTTGSNFGSGLIVGVAGKSAIVANLENGNLRLGTNNLSRLVIDSAGNVAIGNLVPNYKLDIFGDMNARGLIRLNGNSGLDGQVLTSAGTGPAQWKTAALSNSVRFACHVGLTNPASNFGSSRGGVLAIVDSIYNLDPSAVSFVGSSVTINKSGLYHFEGFYTTQFYYNAFTPATPPYNNAYVAFGYPGGFNYQIASYDFLTNSPSSNTSYFTSKNFATDVYIVAPKTINFYSSILNVLGPTNVVIQEGVLYGHLISE